jgi:SAM-dependent methyltransferase
MIRRLLRRIILILCFASAYWCAAQVAQKANEDYSTPAKRQAAASEMDHWVRPQAEETDRLIASLGVRAGETLADIGTGVGHLLPYFVRAVGPQGKVIGEDIFPDFLSQAQAKIHTAGWSNVKTVLGTEHDPRLSVGQLDVAVIVDTYHHLDYPGDMLRHIRLALKPRGRLIVVDYYRSRKHPFLSEAAVRGHIRLDRDEVVAEVDSFGFRLLKQWDHLPHEYVLIFVKRG